ncbi:MAG: hypothetical protein LBQ27_01530 [Clostridiales bacterium]|jgi:hypothetical protein|nr:hypothetical protein [Clostridiales bacterium]
MNGDKNKNGGEDVFDKIKEKVSTAFGKAKKSTIKFFRTAAISIKKFYTTKKSLAIGITAAALVIIIALPIIIALAETGDGNNGVTPGLMTEAEWKEAVNATSSETDIKNSGGTKNFKQELRIVESRESNSGLKQPISSETVFLAGGGSDKFYIEGSDNNTFYFSHEGQDLFVVSYNSEDGKYHKSGGNEALNALGILYMFLPEKDFWQVLSDGYAYFSEKDGEYVLKSSLSNEFHNKISDKMFRLNKTEDFFEANNVKLELKIEFSNGKIKKMFVAPTYEDKSTNTVSEYIRLFYTYTYGGIETGLPDYVSDDTNALSSALNASAYEVSKANPNFGQEVYGSDIQASFFIDGFKAKLIENGESAYYIWNGSEGYSFVYDSSKGEYFASELQDGDFFEGNQYFSSQAFWSKLKDVDVYFKRANGGFCIKDGKNADGFEKIIAYAFFLSNDSLAEQFLEDNPSALFEADIAVENGLIKEIEFTLSAENVETRVLTLSYTYGGVAVVLPDVAPIEDNILCMAAKSTETEQSGTERNYSQSGEMSFEGAGEDFSFDTKALHAIKFDGTKIEIIRGTLLAEYLVFDGVRYYGYYYDEDDRVNKDLSGGAITEVLPAEFWKKIAALTYCFEERDGFFVSKDYLSDKLYSELKDIISAKLTFLSATDLSRLNASDLGFRIEIMIADGLITGVSIYISYGAHDEEYGYVDYDINMLFDFIYGGIFVDIPRVDIDRTRTVPPGDILYDYQWREKMSDVADEFETSDYTLSFSLGDEYITININGNTQEVKVEELLTGAILKEYRFVEYDNLYGVYIKSERDWILHGSLNKEAFEEEYGEYNAKNYMLSRDFWSMAGESFVGIVTIGYIPDGSGNHSISYMLNVNSAGENLNEAFWEQALTDKIVLALLSGEAGQIDESTLIFWLELNEDLSVKRLIIADFNPDSTVLDREKMIIYEF